MITLIPFWLSFFSPRSPLFLPSLFSSQSNSVNLCGCSGLQRTLKEQSTVYICLSPLESPLFSSCSSLSPSSLSSSSCNAVKLCGCPSLWRIFSPLTKKFYYQCCIVGEVLRLLEEWHWNPEAGDLSPKTRTPENSWLQGTLSNKRSSKSLHTYTETNHHPRYNKFQSKTYHANSPATQEHSP